MLEANDAKVCTNADVQRTVLNTVDEKYQNYIDEGGTPIPFEAVNATGVDPLIHEIRCSANLAFQETFFDLAAANAPPAGRTPIAFAVRPSLEKTHEFVVSLEVTAILKYRLGAFIANAGKAAAEPTAEPNHRETAPSEAAPTSEAILPTEEAAPTAAVPEDSRADYEDPSAADAADIAPNVSAKQEQP